MRGKAALALGIGAALVAVAGRPASAQAIVGGAYLAVPPLYVEIGPPPGPGYVWVPGHRRWEYRGAFDRDYYRDYDRGYYRGYDRGYDRDYDRDRYRDWDWRRGDRDRWDRGDREGRRDHDDRRDRDHGWR